MNLLKWKLEDVCEILDSKRIPITASERKAGIYPYYGANGIQDYVDDFIFDDELVLLAEDGGNFGSKDRPIAYRVSGKCWVNNHAHVLKPLSMIDVDYLCYALMFYDTSGLVNGATRQKMTQAAMRKMQIPVQKMEEQKKIVEKIKSIDFLIVTRKKQLEKMDQLASSRFVEMFGDIIRNDREWPIHRLADIASSRLGKMLDQKKQTGKNRFPYLANFNVRWFQFDLSTLNVMDFNEQDQQEFALQPGDLLVCEGGEVGRCAVWNNEKAPCFFQKALHRVRCNKEYVQPLFLAWWFKISADNKAFENIAGAKATIAHLPGVKLKELGIPLPPISLQNEFVAYVEQLDKSKVIIRKSIEKLELLYKALLQEYFG